MPRTFWCSTFSKIRLPAAILIAEATLSCLSTSFVIYWSFTFYLRALKCASKTASIPFSPLIFRQIIYIHFISSKFPGRLILCLYIKLLPLSFISKSLWLTSYAHLRLKCTFLSLWSRRLYLFISTSTVNPKLQTDMCKWILDIFTLGHLKYNVFTPELIVSPHHYSSFLPRLLSIQWSQLEIEAPVLCASSQENTLK